MKYKYATCLAASAFLLASCSGSSDSELLRNAIPDRSKGTYTVTLDDIELVKKGSSEALDVPDLPAPGATLTKD